MRVLDDLFLTAVPDAEVHLQGVRQAPVAKEDGFFAFSDLLPGTYQMSIQADRYRRFDHLFALPLPASDRVVLSVPGENELQLSVQTVDVANNEITFASLDLREPIPVGAPVVWSRGTTQLTSVLDGEGTDSAELVDLGTGPDQIQPDDIVRVIRQPLVRLRPGPYYAFDPALRYVTGTVRDAVTGALVPGATVELARVNSTTLDFEDVGPDPSNQARIYSIGLSLAKRVVGTDRDVFCPVSTRARYAFYFAPRADLTVDQVSVRASAPGYLTTAPVEVDLSSDPHAEQALDMAPS